MDKILNIYLIATNVVAFVSLIGFIALISHRISTKNPFKVMGWIILFITIIGMYLFVPSRLFLLGALNQNINYFENAIKFSINPIEKRLCWLHMGYAYEFKDGNKAIEYIEKALKGEYLKYKEDAMWLSFLYLLKGDYTKAIELNKILDIKDGAVLRNSYILSGEYEKALDAFKENSKSVGDKFLQADLYKKIGKIKKADLLFLEAQNTYNQTLKGYSDEIEKLKYQKNIEQYKSIEKYKKRLDELKKMYGF